VRPGIRILIDFSDHRRFDESLCKVAFCNGGTAALRICIIGDSHVAALKTGWSSLSREFLEVRPIFFAAACESLSALKPVGKTLGTEDVALRAKLAFTSGGSEYIAAATPGQLLPRYVGGSNFFLGSRSVLICLALFVLSGLIGIGLERSIAMPKTRYSSRHWLGRPGCIGISAPWC